MRSLFVYLTNFLKREESLDLEYATTSELFDAYVNKTVPRSTILTFLHKEFEMWRSESPGEIAEYKDMRSCRELALKRDLAKSYPDLETHRLLANDENIRIVVVLSLHTPFPEIKEICRRRDVITW